MAASDKNTNAMIRNADVSQDRPTVVDREELQQELARLRCISTALTEAKGRKDYLMQKLQFHVHVREKSVRQSNELEEMRWKLDDKKLAVTNMLMDSKIMLEGLKTQRERLTTAIRPLLSASKALSATFNQLQDSCNSVTGKKGSAHLKNLQKMRLTREQYMLAQVSSLYPVKASIGHDYESSHEKKPVELKEKLKLNRYLGDEADLESKSNRKYSSSMTIAGQPLILPSLRMSIFSDKKEAQKSAAALGYVAHAVSLIASYLDVPLRYPLRLGGSRSYILDHASVDPTPLNSLSSSIFGINTRSSEFPLFLDGCDGTRAAYAIFLLNKDLELLLNYVGAESMGPRHVLANLKELYRTVQSLEYINRIS